MLLSTHLLPRADSSTSLDRDDQLSLRCADGYTVGARHRPPVAAGCHAAADSLQAECRGCSGLHPPGLGAVQCTAGGVRPIPGHHEGVQGEDYRHRYKIELRNDFKTGCATFDLSAPGGTFSAFLLGPNAPTQPAAAAPDDHTASTKPEPREPSLFDPTIGNQQCNAGPPFQRCCCTRVQGRHDTLQYLEKVKLRFTEQSPVYHAFVKVMKQFKAQTMETTQAIRRVCHLCNGHKN